VYVVFGGATGWMTRGQLFGALGAAVIGIVCLIVYVGMLALLRAPELAPALGIAKRLIRR
jgi:putative peptidoglycan lipid II flippase